MLTLHVYSTAPSGIGSKQTAESTTARKVVQSTPGVQPRGRKANPPVGLLIAGFSTQSGCPLGPARIVTADEPNEIPFAVATTCSPAVRKVTDSDTVSPGAP